MIYDPFVCEKTVVDGLTVYWKSVPTSPPVVHFRVLMNVGARHDISPNYGTAHFFEHMPFDGCEGFPTWNDIHTFDRSKLLESLNAGTSMDSTVFMCRSKIEDVQLVADFLGKLVFRPILDEKEVERERSVITQEIWRRYDNPKEIELTKERMKMMYNKHVLSDMLGPAGEPKSILGISRSSLKDFHATYYNLANTTLVLSGKLDEATVVAIARTIRTHVTEGTVQSSAQEPIPTPMQKEHIISRSAYFNLSGDAIPKQTALNFVSIHTLEPKSAVKIATINALQIALHESLRSALGATYDVHVSHSDYIDHTKTVISTQIDPIRLDEARNVVTKTIDLFIAQDEKMQTIFEEAKTANINRLLVAEYDTAKIANLMAEEISTYGNIESLEETLRQAKLVTYPECGQWLQQNLLPNLVTFIDTP